MTSQKNKVRSKLKKRLYGPASALFILAISFFILQMILFFFVDYSPPLIDLVTVTSIMALAFILHLLFKFNKSVPLLLTAGFMVHIIGLYKIIPYNPGYVGTLYGAPQLGFHYDWIVHTIGFGFLATALSSVTYDHLKKGLKSSFIIFIVLLFCSTGLGALNEVTEYLGYGVYGYGEGFMEFGDGDSSPDAGPWQNASMDMVNNLLGGIIFIGFFVLRRKYKDSKHRNSIMDISHNP